MATPSEPKQEKSDAEAADTRRPPASASVPAHIAARYLIEKDRYHFPDRQAAFVDRGARLTVQTQNTSVLKDLIAIAQARGWHGVQVSGTEAFRREAWAAASAVGLEVKGYTPSSLERDAAQRARERENRNAPASEPTPASAPPAGAASSPPSTTRTRAQATAEAIRSAATAREELQLNFPEVSEAVFKRLDTHEAFANAFVKAGLVREADRQQVIALMRERLAAQLARGQSPQTPDERRVKILIARAVGRAAADLGAHRAPVELSVPPRDIAPPEQGRGGR